jgi:hypothetical protein
MMEACWLQAMAAKEIVGVDNILEKRGWKAPLYMMITETSGGILKELVSLKAPGGLGTRGNMEESALREAQSDFFQKEGWGFETGVATYDTLDGSRIRRENL